MEVSAFVALIFLRGSLPDRLRLRDSRLRVREYCEQYQRHGFACGHIVFAGTGSVFSFSCSWIHVAISCDG
jgi:hypothetical protein